MKKSIKQIFRLVKYLIIIAIENMFFWLPMKNNRIVLYAHARKGYTCNPKYIAEYLLENYPGQYELIWVSCYPETCTHLKDKSIKVVKAKTLKHFYYTMTACVNITNDFWLFNRKEQLSINTWHGGGAYKKFGMATEEGLGKYIHKLTYRHTDCIITSCEAFVQISEETFGFGPEKFLRIGLPRNDLFFKEKILLDDKFYSDNAISKDTKLVLFAPTFRENTNGIDLLEHTEEICDTLKKRFGGSWRFLYRGHYFTQQINNLNSSIIDCSNYQDVQELLNNVDVLITDYSSLIWDFGLTKKPCFTYIPDFQIFQQFERGFYTPLTKWPYSSAISLQELKNNILFFDEKQYWEHLNDHYITMKSYESGRACEAIAKLIFDKTYAIME